MSERLPRIVSILVILSTFVLGGYFYPAFPSEIASHWGANGEVNGYMPKFWGVFFIPMLMAIFFALLSWLPRIDPLRNNIARFRTYYDGFILVLMVFLFYVYLVTLLWNMGNRFNIGTALAPGLAAFWLFTGLLLPHIKRNWFVGIRTPWTLSDEGVWDETHRIGGKLFQYSGLLSLIGLLFPDLLMWFVFLPIICSTIGIVVYSYLLYKRKGLRS